MLPPSISTAPTGAHEGEMRAGLRRPAHWFCLCLIHSCLSDWFDLLTFALSCANKADPQSSGQSRVLSSLAPSLQQIALSASVYKLSVYIGEPAAFCLLLSACLLPGQTDGQMS